MAPKERRKGKKEIHKNNQESLSFYLKFAVIGTGYVYWCSIVTIVLGIGIPSSWCMALPMPATTTGTARAMPCPSTTSATSVLTLTLALQIGHLVLFYLFSERFSWWNYFFVVFGVVVHAAAYKMLEYMARPYLGPGGELLEAGTDLSDSYFSEYAIDAIILTAMVQVASFVSNYCWLLWLGVPGLIFYRVWVLILWPWFTSGPPNAQGDEGKEGRKLRQRQRVKRIH